MTPPQTSPKQASAARSAAATGTRTRPARISRTQLKLFEAAMVIMSEKGPTATTVDEVAARAGVSKGTVYYNFGSKNSMVAGLLRYGIRLVMGHVHDAGAGVADSRERIFRGVVAGLRFLEENPGFARLAVAEVWRPTGDLAEDLAQARADMLRQVTDMVADLARDHPVPEHPAPGSVAVGVFGSLYMLAMDREMRHSDRTTQESARTVMTMIDGYLANGRAEASSA